MFPRLIGSQPVANRFPPPLTASVATPLSLTSALPARHGPSRIIGLLPLTVGCCSPQAHRRPPRTNSATAWNNRYANRRPTRPNQSITGAISTPSPALRDQISQPLEQSVRSDSTHTPKSASHWSNQYAQTPLTRPNQPPTGRKQPPAGGLNDQNSQSLAESGHQQMPYATKSSSHWNNPDAKASPARPNQPPTGRKQPPTDRPRDQIIHRLE